MAATAHIIIEGSVADGFEPVREAFVEKSTQRGQLGGACCVYRDGERVVDCGAACATASRGRVGRPTP